MKKDRLLIIEIKNESMIRKFGSLQAPPQHFREMRPSNYKPIMLAGKFLISLASPMAFSSILYSTSTLCFIC